MAKKDNVCKHCQAVNQHFSFQCSSIRKPIGTVTDITKEWKARNSKSTDVVNKKFYIKVKPKISPISEKQKVRLARYRVVRDAFMKLHPTCQANLNNCTIKATDTHHKAGKTGNLLWDDKYFLALCRNCHTAIEIAPAMAKERGFSVDRLDK